MGLPIGSQRITADGVVGTSGADIRVFAIVVRSTSGGAAVVNLRNGTTVSDTIWDVIDVGAASTTTRVVYAGGLLLKGGAYIDVDANTSFVSVIYALNIN